MAFDGTEGEVIPLELAAKWTKNWRDWKEAGDIKGITYGKENLLAILGQEGCVGIKMYFAINDNAEKVLILVGVDANENDILDGVLIEFGTFCPPTCGGINILNSNNG